MPSFEAFIKFAILTNISMYAHLVALVLKTI